MKKCIRNNKYKKWAVESKYQKIAYNSQLAKNKNTSGFFPFIAFKKVIIPPIRNKVAAIEVDNTNVIFSILPIFSLSIRSIYIITYQSDENPHNSNISNNLIITEKLKEF